MLSGLAHRRIASLTLVALLGATVYTYDELVQIFRRDSVFEYSLVFVLAFLAGTYLLSPDLDLADSDPSRSWGDCPGDLGAPYPPVSSPRFVSRCRGRNADPLDLTRPYGIHPGGRPSEPYGVAVGDVDLGVGPALGPPI